MSASVSALAAQVQSLRTCCPVLLPALGPGMGPDCLLIMAAAEGRTEAGRLHGLLEEASSRGAAASSRCCICSAPGRPFSPSSGADDGSILRFSVLSELDFAERAIRISRGGFACGDCRAVSEPWRFIHFAALGLGQDQPQREEVAHRLCLHFAAVNQAPDQIIGHPDNAVMWTQEVMTRAYGLKVIAGSLQSGSWKLIGPDGMEMGRMDQPAKTGTAVRCAKLLMAAAAATTTHGSASKEGAQRKEIEKQEGSGAANVLVKGKRPKSVKSGDETRIMSGLQSLSKRARVATKG